MEVVMTDELDAEEVEGLTLVPVHAGEDAFGGGDTGRSLGNTHHEPALVVVLKRAQLIDDVVARQRGLAIGPIDGGDEQWQAKKTLARGAEQRQGTPHGPRPHRDGPTA